MWHGYDVSMTLANMITIARALLIVPILYLFLSGHRVAAFFLFGVSSAGDVLDGMVARARNEITTWGKALDPAADKALYVSLLFSLYVVGDISVVAVILFLAPQVALGVGAIALRVKRQAVQGARMIGKAAALLSFLAIAFLIIGWPGGRGLFYAAIAATYVATLDYFRAGMAIRGRSS